MSKARPASFVVLALLLAAVAALAQEAAPPESIQTALADLSRRIGETLALDSPRLQDWAWAEEFYPDVGLGCPQPGEHYEQIMTPGFTYVFTVDGTTYDYRASEDGQTVFLCASFPAQTDAEATPTIAPGSEPEGTIGVGNAAEVVELERIEGNFTSLMEWSPSGQTIAAAYSDPRNPQQLGVLVFDAANLSGYSWRVTNFEPVTALAYYYDAPDAFVVSGGQMGDVRIFPVEPQGFDVLEMLTDEDNQPVTAVAIAPDGRVIASAGAAAFAATGEMIDAVNLWNARTGRLLSTLESETPIYTVTFSPGGQYVVYGGENGSLYAVDVVTQGDPVVLAGHEDAVRDLAFNAEGTRLASAGMDGTVRVWNTEGGAENWSELLTLTAGSDAPLRSVDFNAAGTVIASAGGDPDGARADFAVYLWNAFTGEELAALAGHSAPVGSVSFNHDGARLASAGDDRTLILWGLPG